LAAIVSFAAAVCRFPAAVPDACTGFTRDPPTGTDGSELAGDGAATNNEAATTTATTADVGRNSRGTPRRPERIAQNTPEKPDRDD